MRGKEASSDTSAEGLRLPAAGLGTTPHRSEAAASPPTPTHELQKLRGGGLAYREGPAAFPGCCGHPPGTARLRRRGRWPLARPSARRGTGTQQRQPVLAPGRGSAPRAKRVRDNFV